MTPRVVVVRRTTEYEELIARHATVGQAAFFLESRGQSLDPLVDRHERTQSALDAVARAIPVDWRRAAVERAELNRFVFGPDDIVVVVGPDGLVANVAKYLEGQCVLGVDPVPMVNAGVLVCHSPAAVPDLLQATAAGRVELCERTMVEASVDDGQTLTALNEIFLGRPDHQSARYELSWRETTERQSSSGMIVGTGTGATGWLRSLQRIQAPDLRLPSPSDPTLAWFVREPWPSPSTGADLVAGLLEEDALTVRVESDSLVVFGDGIEADRITLTWGQQVRLLRAERTLRTVVR
ncbi:NAD(+)/NADH kinase [Aeromicrobium terrae]|uniref:NAD kinase n=1 Tax=Aeromicrobium terrae TaxID=2498846 RepID=A0A5C8NHW0_9ACTN|nr:NAD(+)/NADH kinase [Aeromicrobium terrae]TXL60666.1 hypothetical protein FHP06_09530 [Aeromicrobium terrae]